MKKSFTDRWAAKKPINMSSDEKDAMYREILSECTLVADCWLYPHTNAEGYGTKTIARATRNVSRFTLCYVTRESIDRPSDIAACHDTRVCPYRNCCNPRHLFWGTYSDNSKMREADARAMREGVFAEPVPLGHETHEQHAAWVAERRESQHVDFSAPRVLGMNLQMPEYNSLVSAST
jgi:hypothetical protein